jgi:hypothetical protein
MAFILLLVACILLLLYRPALWPEAAARIGVVPSEFPAATDRESPFSIAPQTKTTSASPRALPTLDKAQATAPSQDQHATLASLPYRFPTRAEITIGANKADILAAFGPAHVSITGADRGQLQERMIYTERSTAKKTIIAIVNGRVTNVETFAADDGTQE